LPLGLAQLAEIVRLRKDLTAVVSWGEASAYPVALLLRLLRHRPAHVAILLWISKPKKAWPLRVLQPAIDRFIIRAPLQREFARNRIGIPSERIVDDARWGVDTRFWRPGDEPTDLICCVGREMRDYPTFVEAVRPLGIPCHIAAAAQRTVDNPWFRPEGLDLPGFVTIGGLDRLELRRLYERSRFVVIPLLPSDNDNGITVALEAMAMGKPVICTDTAGQVGVLDDGVTCLRVPPGDVVALRAAIERLWGDEDLCRRMGVAGRALVERKYRVEDEAAQVRATVEAAIRSRTERLAS
jgi:glycosyltransferase involved in cell wall biosynthesis